MGLGFNKEKQIRSLIAQLNDNELSMCKIPIELVENSEELSNLLLIKNLKWV